MDVMFGVACGLNKTKKRLTVVIDKGMNADFLEKYRYNHTWATPEYINPLTEEDILKFSPCRL
jgi:hypothetical protein